VSTAEFLLPLLACPSCGGALLGEGDTREIEGLACPEGHGPGDGGVFPVTLGVPRLLPAGERAGAEQRTIEAFERQWRDFGDLERIFGKKPEEMAANLVGARMGSRIDAAWYVGKRVLDAGCGHGRYLHAFRSLGAQVVGLDIGGGPEEVGIRPEGDTLALVQGSVLQPPFADETFDLVFSDGVIHHTPDAARAYRELARLVKPGGALYVWVYPREGWLRETFFGTARAVTTRLPGFAVRWLSYALAPLTVFVRSYSGTKFGRASWAECAQVVHDWIAPPLQSHHTQAEVAGWAEAAGLGDLEVLPIPTGLVAWRPPAEGSVAVAAPAAGEQPAF